MSAPRPYQAKAIADVRAEWQHGHRSVCLVAPTGSGKTFMGTELASGARSAVWLAHRSELVDQAAESLRRRFGRWEVGIVAPGHQWEPHARVQVASVQTLLARGSRPPAELIVGDEFHHYAADDWSKALAAYPDARMLGLTATPERRDGRPLGDLASALVVAASYSELLRDGHLVPCRVFQPPEMLGARELAVDPVAAYRRHVPGQRCFVFVGTIKAAKELAERFAAEGIPAACVDANTKRSDRRDAIDRFRAGELLVLTNVYALTEGVDVPAASACIIGRGCDHVGMYLQIVGRVLRPAPGKQQATLIDLVGATLRHGLPTEDRLYSLDGEGIKRTSATPVRSCLKCGASFEAWLIECPVCGYVAPKQEPKLPTIYDLELREVYAGAATPGNAKEREYKRLRELGRSKGWSLYFVQKEFKKLFHEEPTITDASEEERLTELSRLLATVRDRGYKPGFASFRYKQLFGRWPTRTEQAQAAALLTEAAS